MIVPSFWAEARRHIRRGNRQITVRRWGWSDTSEADAQAMAEARAEEALALAQTDNTLERRERKVAYNGAQGVPIREEVLERHGDTVITRNAYGAKCLNTPTCCLPMWTLIPPCPAGCMWRPCACWPPWCCCPRGGCWDHGGGWRLGWWRCWARRRWHICCSG